VALAALLAAAVALLLLVVASDGASTPHRDARASGRETDMGKDGHGTPGMYIRRTCTCVCVCVCVCVCMYV
jgi:hypothetical protein